MRGLACTYLHQCSVQYLSMYVHMYVYAYLFADSIFTYVYAYVPPYVCTYVRMYLYTICSVCYVIADVLSMGFVARVFVLCTNLCLLSLLPRLEAEVEEARQKERRKMMEELESVKKALEDEKSSIYTQVHVLQEELVSLIYCTYTWCDWLLFVLHSVFHDLLCQVHNTYTLVFNVLTYVCTCCDQHMVLWDTVCDYTKKNK